MTPQTKKTAGWLAIAIAAVGAYEGCVLNTYPDIVGIPTYCYGETRGAKLGQTFDKSQCDDMLAARLLEFNGGVNQCVKVPLPDARRAAFVSLSYNIGTAAFCKSTVVRKINAGDVQGACDSMLLWNRAGGKPVQGLTNRRIKEREMCLRNES